MLILWVRSHRGFISEFSSFDMKRVRFKLSSFPENSTTKIRVNRTFIYILLNSAEQWVEVVDFKQNKCHVNTFS